MAQANEPGFISKDEAVAIIESTSPSNLVLWVGAGVDYDVPRCLPLSKDLVDCIIKQLLPGRPSDEFFGLWSYCSKLLYGTVAPPRLETLIDAVKLFEGQLDAGYSVLSGLSFFNEAPPNGNTFALAKAVLAGANVVTTNYSTAIEDAAASDDANYEYCLRGCGDSPTFRISQSLTGDFGPVYHIHGTSTDIGTMGITLPLISQRFPFCFRAKMDEWLRNPACVFVFAGYSGSDEYDVNKFLAEWNRENEGLATGIYLRHGSSVDPASPGERKLLNPFRSAWICSATISEALSFGVASVASAPSYAWGERFKKLVRWPTDLAEIDRLSKMCALVLSDYFGLNLSHAVPISIGDIESMKRALPPSSHWYVDYYAVRYAEVSSDAELIKSLGGTISNSADLRRTYYGVKGDVEMADACYRSIEAAEVALEFALSEGSVIDWDSVSAPINHAAMRLIRNLGSSCRDRSEASRWVNGQLGVVERLAKCSDMALKMPYDKMESLRQTATASRANGIATSLLHVAGAGEPQRTQDALDGIDRALGLYADISSINGYALTLACRGFVLASFGNGGEADEALKRARDIAVASLNESLARKVDEVGRSVRVLIR